MGGWRSRFFVSAERTVPDHAEKHKIDAGSISIQSYSWSPEAMACGEDRWPPDGRRSRYRSAKLEAFIET